MWSAVKKAYQNRRENIDKPEKKSSKKIEEKVRKTVDKKEIPARNLHGINRAPCLCHPGFLVQSILQ